MLFVGNSRAGGRQLAQHLQKDENDHVEIHEMRGFAGANLEDAFQETHAISQGTKCKKYLFSLSLNPPQEESVPVDVFEDAISRVEQKLGFEGQPRAIVFHEKEGRRHAHCVWSRIDIDQMKAVEVNFYKKRLMEVSREIYIEHGWKMPDGMIDRSQKSPLNYSLAEHQQAKRTKQDPKELKAFFQQCWAASDSQQAFAAALKERGLYLSQGDRRGHVAVDCNGEVFAVSKWTGNKVKDVRAKLGKHTDLPPLSETKDQIANDMKAKLHDHMQEADQISQKNKASHDFAKAQTVQQHRMERAKAQESQKQRWQAETALRSEKFARGFRGVWQFVIGKQAKIRKENELEVQKAQERDQRERQVIINRHLQERRAQEKQFDQQRQAHIESKADLKRDESYYDHIRSEEKLTPKQQYIKDQIHRSELQIRSPNLEPER